MADKNHRRNVSVQGKQNQSKTTIYDTLVTPHSDTDRNAYSSEESEGLSDIGQTTRSANSKRHHGSNDEDEDEEQSYGSYQQQKKRRQNQSSRSHLTSKNHRDSSPQSNETLILTIERLRKKLKEAHDRIRDTERSLQVAKFAKTKRSRANNDDATTRQYKSELRGFIKYGLGRRIKFLPKHFEMWSDKENSVCQMVMTAIQFHPDITDEEKMTIWSSVLAPNMTYLFTEYKNKIHQPMRLCYMSKCQTIIFRFLSKL